MNQSKIENIAKEIWDLELKHQSKDTISKQFEAIDKIASKLTLKELFAVAAYIEEHLA